MKTPIAVFAFNRASHLKKTLDHLRDCKSSSERHLIIHIDGPRNNSDIDKIEEVHKVALGITGFLSSTVVKSDKNKGCAKSIIEGISNCFKLHERLIVIEDDILCNPNTLEFLDSALDKYNDRMAAFSISAWAPPPKFMTSSQEYPYGAFFAPRFHCWGWATWKNRWQLCDWSASGCKDVFECQSVKKSYSKGGGDLPGMLQQQLLNNISSWDILTDYTRFRHGGLTLYPVRSFTTNIGFDGSGLHCGAQDPYANDITLADPDPLLPDHVFVDEAMAATLRRAYDPLPPPTLRQRVVGKLRRMAGRA